MSNLRKGAVSSLSYQWEPQSLAERASKGIAVPYLRAWRMYHAISQTDLAEQCGLNRLTIARAEAGEHFSFANIRKVAECLGISVQQLLREDPNGAPQPSTNVGNREDGPTP